MRRRAGSSLSLPGIESIAQQKPRDFQFAGRHGIECSSDTGSEGARDSGRALAEPEVQRAKARWMTASRSLANRSLQLTKGSALTKKCRFILRFAPSHLSPEDP
jgi:hypothetical protein